MNVIVTIPDNGKPREAIPVRAIPWATNSTVSPLVVAKDLARISESELSDTSPRLKNATAYYLIGSGKTRAMAPKEWDAVVRNLSRLSNDLKEKDLPSLEERRQWEIRATEILPAGTFLWKDEFESAYRSCYVDRYRWTILNEREGDRGYTCDPIIRHRLEETILKGFGAAIEPSENPSWQAEPLAPTTFSEIDIREKLRSIQLRWLFQTLELTRETMPSFEILAMLRRKGLKLTAAPDGDVGCEDPIHYEDISVALERAAHDYQKLSDDEWDAPNGNVPDYPKREAAIWKHEVPVCPGDPDNERRIPVGDLWVKKDDFAEICRRLGKQNYHWPKIHWPSRQEEIEERGRPSIPEPVTGMDYSKAGYWDVREAAILLLGYTPVNDDGVISAVDAPPLEPGETEQVEAICELAWRAMDTRDLPYVSKRKKRWIKPVEFLNWARSKGYSIPQALISAFLVPQQETETAQALQRSTEQDKESVAFENTISFHEAREHLRERLGANDFEIRQWIRERRIKPYSHGVDEECEEVAPGRRDMFEFRRFLREEIDHFSPRRHATYSEEPSGYRFFHICGFLEPEASDDHGFNPSGRFISFQEAVAFLSAFGDANEIVQNLRSHEDENYLSAFGFDDDASLEECYFYESQIVGLVVTVYGRPFDGWSAISDKRISEAVPVISAELQLEGHSVETNAIPHSDALDATTADQKPIGRPPKTDKLANRLEDLRTAAREIVHSPDCPKALTRDTIAKKLMMLDDWREYTHDTLVGQLRAGWWKDLKGK